MVCKPSRWIPHELTEENRCKRVKICKDLYYTQLSEPFIDNLITGDEKWILYENIKRRKEWLPKGEAPSFQVNTWKKDFIEYMVG
jgi:[histone H3]-lysine36 N-dimethyltransferase SETMAR